MSPEAVVLETADYSIWDKHDNRSDSTTGWVSIVRAPIDSQEAVRDIARRLAEAAERTRDRMNRLGELDLASQDVLIEVLRELEKQLWMVRVQFSQPEE